MKILIVEKSKELKIALQSFFEIMGCKSIAVENPKTALSLSSTIDFDIIISEYFSEDENYLKLFKQISSNKKQTKIIILTAINYNWDELKPLHDLGIKTVFQKPIDPKTICESINSLSQNHKLSITL